MSGLYDDDSRVRELTERIAEGGVRVLQIFRFADTEEDHVRVLYDMLRPRTGHAVLDVGSGTGRVAALMHEIDPSLRFTLLNISQEQLDMSPPFTKVCADMRDSGLPEASFDRAMINYALGHGDLLEVLYETARVLKPGGRLMVVDMLGPSAPVRELLQYETHGPSRISAATAACGLTVVDVFIPPASRAEFDRVVTGTMEEMLALDAALDTVTPCAWVAVKEVA